MSAHGYCVGLTGGIGSGKSAVADRFARLGAAVIDTDVIAHELTAPGGGAIAAIIDAFGSDVVTPTGALDRAAMRKRVFTDPRARERLEAILHPMIRAEVALRLSEVDTPYSVLVVPLLVENLDAYRPLLERIVVVDCEPGQQLARTAQRPGLDHAQAKAILAAQISSRERLRFADDVIDNRGDFANLDSQIQRLHGDFLRLAALKCG